MERNQHLDITTLKNTDYIGAILQKLKSFPVKNTIFML